MITVTNTSTREIKVAINQWGNDGNTSYFPIAPKGGSDTWNRSDDRGFVMVLQRSGAHVAPYYVTCNSNITVSGSDVKDGEDIIMPIK